MPRPQARRHRLSDPWVGPWLRSMRATTTLTSEDIAMRLNIGRSSVSRLESGASSIPADDLPKVLDAYDLTPGKFAARALKAA